MPLLSAQHTAPFFFETTPPPNLATPTPAAPILATFAPRLTPAPFFSSSLEPASDPSLPEAPTPQLTGRPKPKPGTDPAERIARKRTMVIPPDWHAQPLSPIEKFRVTFEDLYTPLSVFNYFLSAGYEHLNNSEPNYGTDKGAFGERLGAAALRGTTQAVFTNAVFAPLLHEDPRYYVKGRQYSPVRRGLGAVARPFLTRKDDGSRTLNGSLLLGYAAAAALTPAYYPRINHTFHDVASVYGGSVGGSAVGFGIAEFSEEILRAAHLTRLP